MTTIRSAARQFSSNLRAIETLKTMGVTLAVSKLTFRGMAYRHEVKFAAYDPHAVTVMKAAGYSWGAGRHTWVNTAANTIPVTTLLANLKRR